jgi:signal transduction histidine kinase
MPSNETDQKLYALIEALGFAGVGTWEWDFKSDRVQRNESMAILLSAEPDQLNLSYPEAFAPIFPGDLVELQSRMEAAVRHKTAFAMDFRVMRDGDSTRRLQTNGKAIYDAVGKATAMVGITFDDTERVGLAHRLDSALDERDALLTSERAAREMAERADHMKDEFLATLSHELRTPLNAVLGWAQILRLKTASASEEIKRGLEAIERNARLQTQLIDDLLDMSRIISGKVRLDAQPVYPIEAIEAAIETLLPAATSKGVLIERDLANNAGPVLADPSRLQQMVWNLLSNAVKFTPREGTVKVVLALIDNTVKIDVIDSGIGIASDFIDHIFERFRQADASTSRSHNGLGLGLAIVKQLVDLHGGEVSASSPGTGLGTTMTIRLPLIPR